MNHKHFFYRTIIVFILFLGLALTACGGGKSATSTPANTEPPPTPTIPPTPSAADHTKQGEDYFDQGEMDKAIAEFQAAIELEPDNARAHADLGAAYGKQDRNDEAAVVLKKAIELDPDQAKAHTNLCMVYWSQDKLDQAIVECETALKLDDRDADTYNNFGVIYLMQNQPEQAIPQFKTAIEIDPNHDWAHNNLGRIYSNQGRLDEALLELKEALRINPDHAMAHYNLGLTYARMEAYDQAIPEYTKALRLDPDITNAHMDIAILYRDMGQIQEAIAQFETYLELEPNDPQRAALEAEIARLKHTLTPIELVPFIDDELGISGVVPAGWTKEDPGTYVSPDGQVLGQTVAPGQSAAQFAETLLNGLGVAELPESIGSIKPADLEWHLYMLEEVEVYDRTGSLALALAEDEAGAYIIALFAQPEEIEGLIETVGNPALVAFSTGQEQKDATTGLVAFTNAEMGISGLVPAAWTEVSSGVYGNEGGGQVIIQMALPGVTVDVAAASFLGQMGLESLPESDGSRESETLTWDLYILEDVDLNGQTMTVALALAQDTAGAYLFALIARPEEIGTLIETVGNPALDAFTFVGE